MLKKPEWLKVVYREDTTEEVRKLVEGLSLHTVCVEASCPNLGECYSSRTATFMIMGSRCTRNCGFCDVTTAKPFPLDRAEAEQVAEAAAKLGLRHVVITQVTRDDLPDGGAGHMAETIRAVRRALPESTIEVLVSDMQGTREAIDQVLTAEPDVFGHNIEMPEELYPVARQQADYQRSLDVLTYAKEQRPDMLTKTGFMLGLGETDDQIDRLLDDLVKTGVDILTIGQYLQPSSDHVELKRYVSPDEFSAYAERAKKKGIACTLSSPFVRSSYKAAEAVKQLKG